MFIAEDSEGREHNAFYVLGRATQATKGLIPFILAVFLELVKKLGNDKILLPSKLLAKLLES